MSPSEGYGASRGFKSPNKAKREKLSNQAKCYTEPTENLQRMFRQTRMRNRGPFLTSRFRK